MTTGVESVNFRWPLTTLRVVSTTVVVLAILALMALVTARSPARSISSDPPSAAAGGVPGPQPHSLVPRDAVWQSGGNRWAEPAPGATPLVSSAAAIQYFHEHAFYGQDTTLPPPQAHLWLFTSPVAAIHDRLAWFLIFRNPAADAASLGSGPLTGCMETYIVDASTGVGLDDGVACTSHKQ